MDENALIQAARRGDLEAFNQLILSYQDLVHRQVLRILGDDEATEDVTQEVFLRAFKNLSSYRGGSFRAWLLRIARNASYDELRRWKRHPVLYLNQIDDEGEPVESTSWLISPDPSPEESLSQTELRATLNRLLEELPHEQRITIFLVDQLELDYEETADVLGVPIGTVKSRLARARLNVRNRLLRMPEFLPAGFTFKQDEELLASSLITNYAATHHPTIA